MSPGTVERVAFKTYVKNVLPNEWMTSWPAASLEAGAMAVKSFGWYWALHSARKTPAAQCFDVYDNTAQPGVQARLRTSRRRTPRWTRPGAPG